MFFKLTIRNARRSAKDYLLYMTTIIIMAVLIMFSNLLSAASGLVDGISANSIPLIISLVMAALLHYINGFMLRRRSRELATYILLGMKKRRIAAMFFLESFILGAICFLGGMLLGGLCFAAALQYVSFIQFSDSLFSIYTASAFQSFIYFMIIQVFVLAGSNQKIMKLQIIKLLSESRQNEKSSSRLKPWFWSALFLTSLTVFFFFLALVTVGTNKNVVIIITSVIIIPVLISFVSFYRAVFQWFAWFRSQRRSSLYSGNRLYIITQWLSRITSNTMIYTVLSICLFFSAATFATGIIMLYIPSTLFPAEQALWMSFSEICMCIVFIVVYFSVISVRQIVDVRENRSGFAIMNYLGKGKPQLSRLILKETCIKFFMPASLCVLLIGGCVLPLNSILNSLLPLNNILLSALGGFVLCFFILYTVYTIAVYRLSSSILYKKHQS